MKRFIYFATLMTVLCSCGTTPNNGEYYIFGETTDQLNNGKYIYLREYMGDKIDSALITNNKFAFEGKLAQKTIYMLEIERSMIALATENEPITLTFDKEFTLTNSVGESSNIKNVQLKLQELQDEFSNYYENNKNASKDELYKKYDEYTEKVDNLLDSTIKNNQNSIVSVYALFNKISNIQELSTIDSLLAIVPLAKDAQIIQKRIQFLNQKELVAPGKMFVDFEGSDIYGNNTKLSDYVGKGNYVLVDFWASWCGPCRAEMPNLRNVYEKHKSNGLVLLGINVWDKNAAFKQSIKHENMTWPNIFTTDDAKISEKYAIDGIPCIILFAPDGTIVNRTIRGKEIMKLIDTMY